MTRRLLVLASLVSACSLPPASLRSAPPAEPQKVAELAPAPRRSTKWGSILPAPTPLSLDGDLSEWTAPPTALTTTDGVEETRLYVAITRDKLVLAGSVPRPESASGLDLLVSVAFPEPELPKLAYEDQWGEHEVPSAETCSTEVNLAGFDGEPAEALDACVAWVERARQTRRELLDRFHVTYRLTQDTIRVGAVQGRLVASERALRITFEAEISSETLPLSSHAPLAASKVHFALGDGGPAPAQHLIAPTAWPLLALAEPVAFGDAPELLPQLFRDLSVPGEAPLFYAPGSKVTAVQVAHNPPLGYQSFPTQPSPAIESSPLDFTTLGKLGESEILELRVAPELDGDVRTLWSKQGGKLTLLTSLHSFTGPTKVVRRGEALHVLYVQETTRNPYGAGMCGACPARGLNLLRVTPDRADRLIEESFHSDDGEDMSVEVEPKLAWIKVFSLRGEELKKPKRQLLADFRWSETHAAYSSPADR